ncbi:MAG: hypothetical protein WCW01_05160 [Gammaproteobacteria bacterium]
MQNNNPNSHKYIELQPARYHAGPKESSGTQQVTSSTKPTTSTSTTPAKTVDAAPSTPVSTATIQAIQNAVTSDLFSNPSTITSTQAALRTSASATTTTSTAITTTQTTSGGSSSSQPVEQPATFIPKNITTLLKKEKGITLDDIIQALQKDLDSCPSLPGKHQIIQFLCQQTNWHNLIFSADGLPRLLLPALLRLTSSTSFELWLDICNFFRESRMFNILFSDILTVGYTTSHLQAEYSKSFINHFFGRNALESHILSPDNRGYLLRNINPIRDLKTLRGVYGLAISDLLSGFSTEDRKLIGSKIIEFATNCSTQTIACSSSSINIILIELDSLIRTTFLDSSIRTEKWFLDLQRMSSTQTSAPSSTTTPPSLSIPLTTTAPAQVIRNTTNSPVSPVITTPLAATTTLAITPSRTTSTQVALRASVSATTTTSTAISTTQTTSGGGSSSQPVEQLATFIPSELNELVAREGTITLNDVIKALHKDLQSHSSLPEQQQVLQFLGRQTRLHGLIFSEDGLPRLLPFFSKQLEQDIYLTFHQSTFRRALSNNPLAGGYVLSLLPRQYHAGFIANIYGNGKPKPADRHYHLTTQQVSFIVQHTAPIMGLKTLRAIYGFAISGLFDRSPTEQTKPIFSEVVEFAKNCSNRTIACSSSDIYTMLNHLNHLIDTHFLDTSIRNEQWFLDLQRRSSTQTLAPSPTTNPPSLSISLTTTATSTSSSSTPPSQVITANNQGNITIDDIHEALSITSPVITSSNATTPSTPVASTMTTPLATITTLAITPSTNTSTQATLRASASTTTTTSATITTTQTTSGGSSSSQPTEQPSIHTSQELSVPLVETQAVTLVDATKVLYRELESFPYSPEGQQAIVSFCNKHHTVLSINLLDGGYVLSFLPKRYHKDFIKHAGYPTKLPPETLELINHGLDSRMPVNNLQAIYGFAISGLFDHCPTEQTKPIFNKAVEFAKKCSDQTIACSSSDIYKMLGDLNDLICRNFLDRSIRNEQWFLDLQRMSSTQTPTTSAAITTTQTTSGGGSSSQPIEQLATFIPSELNALVAREGTITLDDVIKALQKDLQSNSSLPEQQQVIQFLDRQTKLHELIFSANGLPRFLSSLPKDLRLIFQKSKQAPVHHSATPNPPAQAILDIGVSGSGSSSSAESSSTDTPKTFAELIVILTNLVSIEPPPPEDLIRDFIKDNAATLREIIKSSVHFAQVAKILPPYAKYTLINSLGTIQLAQIIKYSEDLSRALCSLKKYDIQREFLNVLGKNKLQAVINGPAALSEAVLDCPTPIQIQIITLLDKNHPAARINSAKDLCIVLNTLTPIAQMCLIRSLDISKLTGIIAAPENRTTIMGHLKTNYVKEDFLQYLGIQSSALASGSTPTQNQGTSSADETPHDLFDGMTDFWALRAMFSELQTFPTINVINLIRNLDQQKLQGMIISTHELKNLFMCLDNKYKMEFIKLPVILCKLPNMITSITNIEEVLTNCYAAAKMEFIKLPVILDKLATMIQSAKDLASVVNCVGRDNQMEFLNLPVILNKLPTIIKSSADIGNIRMRLYEENKIKFNNLMRSLHIEFPASSAPQPSVTQAGLTLWSTTTSSAPPPAPASSSSSSSTSSSSTTTSPTKL